VNVLTVAPSISMDAVRLAPNLRQADREEVLAASGKSPLDALLIGYRESLSPRTILDDDDQPIAMFGITRIDAGVGAPWLLGSDRILEYRREFIRRSREEVSKIARPWARLTNYVSEANVLHVRWLGWLGASFHELEPTYGAGRVPFRRFELCVTR
jgi:hypothetical protein